MNRNTRIIAKIAGIIVATLICSLLAYYISSAVTGHSLATLSDKMSYVIWQERFFKVTIVTGVLTGICSLIWFILARFAFKINSVFSTGRRTIWALLAAVSFFGSILIPRFYSASQGIQINIVIIALFVLFFTVVGYWLVSIFVTPKPFKYTPLGAQLFSRR